MHSLAAAPLTLNSECQAGMHGERVHNAALSCGSSHTLPLDTMPIQQRVLLST